MIINDHITEYELAKEILKVDIVKHLTGRCECKEQEGQVYPCKANEWLRGAIPSHQIVEDYNYEKQKQKTNKA